MRERGRERERERRDVWDAVLGAGGGNHSEASGWVDKRRHLKSPDSTDAASQVLLLAFIP